jgi:hypothetical protein
MRPGENDFSSPRSARSESSLSIAEDADPAAVGRIEQLEHSIQAVHQITYIRRGCRDADGKASHHRIFPPASHFQTRNPFSNV